MTAYQLVIRVPIFLGMYLIITAAMGHKDPLGLFDLIFSAGSSAGLSPLILGTLLLAWALIGLLLTLKDLCNR